MSPLLGLMPPSDWLPPMLAFAAKATLILLVAGIASLLLWRASAAVRHMVWSVAVLSILALPLLSVLMPAWQVPVLGSVPVAAVAAPAADMRPPVAVSPMEISSSRPGRKAANVEAALQEGAPRAPELAVSLALAGILFGLLWLAVGFWGVARLSRRAEVVKDAEWLRTTQDAADHLGLRRPVLLLRSRRTLMPATWGLLWPAVVIPSDADAWPDDRRSAVLAHELAHVKRFDCLTQAFAQIACILLWWHPLVWYAARRLRVERERACDDLVLAAGARASDYATHLLEIARSHRAMRLGAPALLSIAKPSQLESRLLWVLDAGRARTAPSIRAMLLTVFAGLVVVAPLSAMRPVPASGAGVSSPAPAPSPAPLALSALAGPAPAAVEDGDRPSPARGEQAAARPAARGPAAPVTHSIDDLIAMRSADVDRYYIGALRRVGYDNLSAGQLIAMRGSGVSAAYIAEMNGAGYGRLSPDHLVALSSAGVNAAYIEELRRNGFDRLSVRQVTELRGAGVTGAYIAELRAVGLQALGAEALANLRSAGITADFVRRMAAEGRGPLTPKQLLRLRTQDEDRSAESAGQTAGE